MRRDTLGAIGLIAQEEWRALRRNRVAMIASMLLVALVVTAGLVSLEQWRHVEAERAHHQSTVEQQWNAQPDRHPHRVAHYGHFVFRPLSPLAFFDFGVAPYTGYSLYLEAHRQNSANFSDARQSSLLLRFGQLTPSFVLQTLAPLLILFLAFGCIARDRERGRLRFLLAQGVSGRQLVVGKMLGYAGIIALLATPAFLVLGVVGVRNPMIGGPVLGMVVGYITYLFIWVAIAVLVSALAPRGRHALLTLMAIWMISVVLLPRTLPDVATTLMPPSTRFETEIAIHRDMSRIGDSHNPNDPYFAHFRDRILKQYGVTRVEDLPVNYGGLVMQEGERLTSELFIRYARAGFDQQNAQNRWVSAFGVASPFIALRDMSLTLAGTDLRTYQHFLDAAERYRYELIQALNQLHTEEIRLEGDRGQRLSRDHWHALPKFTYQAPALDAPGWQRIGQSLALLALWLAALVALILPVGSRLERSAR